MGGAALHAAHGQHGALRTAAADNHAGGRNAQRPPDDETPGTQQDGTAAALGIGLQARHIVDGLLKARVAIAGRPFHKHHVGHHGKRNVGTAIAAGGIVHGHEKFFLGLRGGKGGMQEHRQDRRKEKALELVFHFPRVLL